MEFKGLWSKGGKKTNPERGVWGFKSIPLQSPFMGKAGGGLSKEKVCRGVENLDEIKRTRGERKRTPLLGLCHLSVKGPGKGKRKSREKKREDLFF